MTSLEILKELMLAKAFVMSKCPDQFSGMLKSSPLQEETETE